MKKWDRKPRILLVTDSSAIHTGFACVGRHIGMALYNSNNYNLKTIGWFHRPTDEVVPFEIIATNQQDRERIEIDKYANDTFPRVYDEFKPDLVFAIGDSWMVDNIAKHTDMMKKNGDDVKLVLYVPIDGEPIPTKWVDIFRLPDAMVAYGEWGKSVMLKRDKNLKIQSIPHGVDSDIFKPVESEFKDQLKAAFADPNAFLIGCVARNQPRKYLPRLFKAFRYFINPYTICKQCDMLYLESVKKCSCGSEDLFQGPEKKDARMYLHMALQDCGWDIQELVSRFNLKGMVAYPKGLKVGLGVPIQKLAEITASFDVFSLPTSGEGFGLPILEAMSCGIPTVVTDYSAHTEFCQGAADLIRVSEYITEPLTNIERGLVDLKDYCMRLDRLYYDDRATFLKKWGKYMQVEYGVTEEALQEVPTGKELREKMSKASRERALEYDWDKVVIPQWIDLFNKTIEYDPNNTEFKEETTQIRVEEV